MTERRSARVATTGRGAYGPHASRQTACGCSGRGSGRRRSAQHRCRRRQARRGPRPRSTVANRKSLLRASSRAAKFTVSPITVYFCGAANRHAPPPHRPCECRCRCAAPVVAGIVLSHRRRIPPRQRRARGVRILDRRAEQSQKPVAEEFVHDPGVAIQNLDQHRESVVQPRHHLLRRSPRAAPVNCGNRRT